MIYLVVVFTFWDMLCSTNMFFLLNPLLILLSLQLVYLTLSYLCLHQFCLYLHCILAMMILLTLFKTMHLVQLLHLNKPLSIYTFIFYSIHFLNLHIFSTLLSFPGPNQFSTIPSPSISNPSPSPPLLPSTSPSPNNHVIEPPLPSTTTNTRPMITRSKADIFKPKAWLFKAPSLDLDYVEPHSYK